MTNSFCPPMLGGERERVGNKELPDLVVDASCLVDDDQELFLFPGLEGYSFLGATMSRASRFSGSFMESPHVPDFIL